MQPFKYTPRKDPFPGTPIDSNKCAAAVSNGPRTMEWHQCYRKRWGGDWCKQHHPATVAAREKASHERFLAPYAKSEALRKDAEAFQQARLLAEQYVAAARCGDVKALAAKLHELLTLLV